MSGQQLFTPAYTINGVQNKNKDRMAETGVMTVGGGKTLDANRYATKKTVAQGMLDIALLTANASQLKYVLQVGEAHEFYSLMLGLIITSLVLQGLTAVALVIVGALNIQKPSSQKAAVIINHVVLGFSLLILSVDALKMGFDNGFAPTKLDSVLVP